MPAIDNIRLRGIKPGDIGWITYRQAILYAQDLGWDQTYEALVARILSDFVTEYSLKTDAAWIAEMDDRVVGSIFLVADDKPKAARLRLLYVEPETRGSGLGAHLISTCIAGARAAGYESISLWTTDAQQAARRLYVKTGFTLTEKQPKRLFGSNVTGEIWTLSFI